LKAARSAAGRLHPLHHGKRIHRKVFQFTDEGPRSRRAVGVGDVELDYRAGGIPNSVESPACMQPSSADGW
jgi:hypothetical protein